MHIKMWVFCLILFWGCCGVLIVPTLESTTGGVNECANTTVCPAYATCTDTIESYYCTCKQGFLSSNRQRNFRGPGVECKDVDECSKSPPACGPNSKCTNMKGRYKCSCLPGFSSPTGNGWISGKPGHFACSDVDECANPRACPERASCHNSLGSYSCSCNPGFASISGKLSLQGSGGRCEDIDECSQDPSPCGPNSICTNVLGSYSCKCTMGFHPNPQGSWKDGNFSCISVNECADTTVCPAYATCTDTTESYYCTCKQGFLSSNRQRNFRGPGVECKDVDECSQSPPVCGPNSKCTNMKGRYKCSCLLGFSSPTGNGWISGKPGRFACSDVDECANPRACPEHASCHNSLGSYSCSCNPGFASISGELSFQGPGGRCQDIDECSQVPSPCGPNSICTNVLGSYSCKCTMGFHPNPEGSWKDGNFSCISVNECADTTVCPAYATCTDTFESYYCTCKQGFLSSNRQRNFRGPGVECKDVDECSQSPPPCGPNSNCTNLKGRYKCSCLPGFSSPTGNGWISGKPGRFACSDVDECANPRACPEHASCQNSVGSYSCSCNPGFASIGGKLSFQGSGGRCEDIDECSQDPSPCGPNSICTNVLGSYSCKCTMGFHPNPQGSWKDGNFSCINVDECSQSPPPCGPNSSCTNLMGRYKCSCLPGFSSPTGNGWIPGKPGRFACSDVDECANPRACPEHASCHNSLGSYSCSCNPGFASISGKLSFQGPRWRCEDVDECSQSPPPCGPNSNCTNLMGRYKCSCLPGFSSPTGNGWISGKPGRFACSDVDECANPRACPEHAGCHNSVGSYSCSCNPGFASISGNLSFQGSGGRCEDVDECSQSPPPCGPNSNCTNLMGRYKCSCLPGFSSPTGNGWISGKPGRFACSDVDECANPRACPEHAGCHNSVGSYSCSCNPGFASISGNLSFQGSGGRCEGRWRHLSGTQVQGSLQNQKYVVRVQPG
ncbi:fibrillin-1-like [Choloepus didactylus]|uniref:fibrillin-1-like n=1 Tax=Choloepus didactylus TaxID=27675 RepID=UPI00189F3B0F|nr:fibrillin-1-like [Choloepus didactylus]